MLYVFVIKLDTLYIADIGTVRIHPCLVSCDIQLNYFLDNNQDLIEQPTRSKSVCASSANIENIGKKKLVQHTLTNLKKVKTAENLEESEISSTDESVESNLTLLDTDSSLGPESFSDLENDQ